MRAKRPFPRGLLCLLSFLLGAGVSMAQDNILLQNSFIQRELGFAAGGPKTLLVTDARSKQALLTEGPFEFELHFERENETLTLDSTQFAVRDYAWEARGPQGSIFRLDFSAQHDFDGDGTRENLQVAVRYAVGEADYVGKWLTITPCKTAGWILREAVIEELSMVPAFVPMMPFDRYPGNAQDAPQPLLDEPDQRFVESSSGRYVAHAEDMGFFAFVTSPFGKEYMNRAGTLRLSQKTFEDLSRLGAGNPEFRTGLAIIGVYSGPVDVGFKRLKEFIRQRFAVGANKETLVEYETWLVERERISAATLEPRITAMRDAGFFNAFHLDYGWESHWPLTEDRERFPRGLPTFARSAREAGFDMVYWINPLGSKGQATENPRWGGRWDRLLETHPGWFTNYDPDSGTSPGGDDTLCFTGDYYDFVRERLMRLVREGNAGMLYMDGNEWSVFNTSPRDPVERSPAEAEHFVKGRFAALFDELRGLRSDLVVCLSPQIGWSPDHLHWLRTFDQIEFWDRTGGVLGDRQQRYLLTFIFPVQCLNSGWYAEDLMDVSVEEFAYRTLSAISSNPQIQGTRYIQSPNPESLAFLRKYYTFRDRFGLFFRVYQHALGFPTGDRVDGEGHLLAGRGFIILNNPTEEPQALSLPLAEPELEIDAEKDLLIYDWTGLDHARCLGIHRLESPPQVEIPPRTVKIYGVDVGP